MMGFDTRSLLRGSSLRGATTDRPISNPQIVKASGVVTEQVGFFHGGEGLGSFDGLNAVPIHVAVRVVAGVHEAPAAELIDNRPQILVAFKAAHNSPCENIFVGLVNRSGQLVRLSSPGALFAAGARL